MGLRKRYLNMGFKRKFYEKQQEKQRTLYVRLPHVIRCEKDVSKLFTGEIKVRLCRQSTRHCYVIFASVEEQLKNLEAVKNKEINGKRIIVAPAITKPEVNHSKIKKKVVLPRINPDMVVTKTLFVSNIKLGTKVNDLKAAIPGCVSAKLLNGPSKTSRCAMVKMESAQIAAEYLNKLKPRPILGGRMLRINPDTRKRVKSRPLKIYDGDKVITNVFSNKKSNNLALDHIVLEKKV